MKTLCPYCGGEIEFDFIEVTSGSLFTLCPHCQNQLRIAHKDDKFFLIFKDATGKETVRKAFIVDVTPSAKAEFRIDEEATEIELEEEPEPKSRDDAGLKEWGVVTDEKEAAGLSRPNISETEIKRMMSMPPPEPPAPSKYDTVEEHVVAKPAQPKEPSKQVEVTPPEPSSIEDRSPISTGRAVLIEERDEETEKLIEHAPPPQVRESPRRPIQALQARRTPAEPKTTSTLKVLGIAGGILVGVVVVVFAGLWMLDKGLFGGKEPRKPQLSEFKDYVALVEDLKKRYAPIDRSAQYYYNTGREVFFSNTPNSHRKATELFGKAIAADPKFTNAIRYYALTRLWSLEDITVAELKRIGDGLDYAEETEGAIPETLLGKALIMARLNQWEEARRLASSACGMERADQHLCRLVMSFVVMEYEPHRAARLLAEEKASSKRQPLLLNYFLGEAYRRSSQYASAYRAFQDMIRDDPKFGPAYLALAKLFGAIGNFDEAFNQLSKAVEFDSVRVASAVYGAVLARRYFLDPDRALALIDSVYNKGFGNATPLDRSRLFTEKALLLLRKGERQRAIFNLKKAEKHAKQDPMRTVLSYSAGMFNVALGENFKEFKDAVDALEDDWEEDPMFELVRAFAYYDANLLKEASVHYKKLMLEDSIRKPVSIARALLFLESNQFKAGMQALSNLNEIDVATLLSQPKESPFFFPVRLWQKMEEALQSDIVVTRLQDASRVYTALVAFWLEQYEAAVKSFEPIWQEKLRGNEPSKRISIPYAWSLYRLGKLDGAIKVLERQRKATTYDSDVLTVLGYLYEQKAKTTEGSKRKTLEAKALSLYKTALARIPPPDTAYLLYARLALRLGKQVKNLGSKLAALRGTHQDDLLWRQCYFLFKTGR